MPSSVYRFALLFPLLIVIVVGCSRSSPLPAKTSSKSSRAAQTTTSASSEAASAVGGGGGGGGGADKRPPLPNLPATGVSRIDPTSGILITAKGKQRRPPSDDEKFVDVMDGIVLVAPATHDGGIVSNCDLQDVETGELVGNVSTGNVAPGGSVVECVKLAAHAKVVVMMNTSGSYAREVSSGRVLPCGDGVFADDFKTCLRIDTSPLVYIGNDSRIPARDFPIEICAVEYTMCRPLFNVPGGLNRAFGTRNWDAAYCANDRVAIVADGKLRIFNARSRRELSVEPAPSKTKVTCANGTPVTS
jgi:hypothetical protein